jgi:ABC-2 type transport system permease protein
LLWIFSSNWNVLDAGFGDINLFFELNPWLFIFLLPALGMKSFSEEFKVGTIELLLTKPIGIPSLIAGKFLALMSILLIALSVSFFYFLQLNHLLLENNTLDWGVFYGSFLGLFFLVKTLAAISLWASTMVESAFSAFLIALFISIFHFYGWNQIADLLTNFDLYTLLKSIGLQYHYGELNKGIIRLSNVIYLVLQTLFFLFWTMLNIKNKCQ